MRRWMDASTGVPRFLSLAALVCLTTWNSPAGAQLVNRNAVPGSTTAPLTALAKGPVLQAVPASDLASPAVNMPSTLAAPATPAAQMPVTQAPVTQAPVTQAPVTQAPVNESSRRGTTLRPAPGLPLFRRTTQPAPAETGPEVHVLRCPSAEDLQKQLKPISSLHCDISVPAENDSEVVPPDCAAQLFSQESPQPLLNTARTPLTTQFAWAAPGLSHRPLYFEDAPLERYGQSICPPLQPVISGARFFSGVLMLPYKMALDPPNRCQYTLGYFRPGSCAPPVRQRVPLNYRALAVEAGVITGLIFLIP